MRDKKIVVLVSIFAVIIVLAVYNMRPSAKGKPKSAAVAGAVLVPVPEAAGALSAQYEAGKSQYSGWGRDPFTKLQGGAAIKLTGILRDKEKFEAIINDKMMIEGGKVDSYTVVKIKKDSVILNDGKQDIEVTLSK